MKPSKRDIKKIENRSALKRSTEQILFRAELRDIVLIHKAILAFNKQIILN